jgi:hypothetical protein
LSAAVQLLLNFVHLLWAIRHSSSSSEDGDSSDDDDDEHSSVDGSLADEHTAVAEGITATAGALEAADSALSEAAAELDLTAVAGDNISESSSNLLVPHVNWTDDVLWNSDDDRSKKRRSSAAAAIAASAPLLLTNGKSKSVDDDTLYESEDESGAVTVTRVPAVRYGKSLQSTGSKSSRAWAVTREPITINRDLSGGDWVKDIVWNDEQRLRPSKLILTQRDVDMLATVGKTARPVLIEKRPVGGECTTCSVLSNVTLLMCTICWYRLCNQHQLVTVMLVMYCTRCAVALIATTIVQLC